ncbi:NAD-dependent epimerase/dehydratase [Dillenia turbinata]|uniref:NAD-dependent epimerase/dehydratase n=1 Tax=Dillenia turbinata TaxID=194707 RepID=A0AAN8Z4D8_9MAGN
MTRKRDNNKEHCLRTHTEIIMGEKGVVCVTGGTGYIASWLIMRLLERGYVVHTTMRPNPEGKQKDITYLTNLQGAQERLHIFYADINKPDSFKEAIDGCIGVFHVAHPLDFTGKEPVEVMTKRCVEGTLGLLKSCLDSNTMKRVVLTSSIATLAYSGKHDELLDESFWNDLDFFRSFNKFLSAAYVESKTMQEKAAWEFADKNGLDLVTVLPSLVVGPFLTPQIALSVYGALAMIFGKTDHYEDLVRTHMVHIDDVVNAHIFLLENPIAKGRYICSSHQQSIYEMSEFLSTRYPEYSLPTPEELKEVKSSHVLANVSSKKLLDLGFHYKYGLEEMFDGAIQSCKERGFL